MSSDVLAEPLVHSYERDGFLALRGVFQRAEIARVADEADRLLGRSDLIDPSNLRCRFKPGEGGGAYLFETFDPVVDIAPRSAELAADARIAAVLAAIYGDAARLFKDKLIFKPPGAVGYGLHQDYVAWPHFPRSFISVLVPIDATDLANGCTEVFPGYHRQGCLSPEDGEYHGVDPALVDEDRVVALELEPGDLALFGCFTPHRSGPNRSDRWRRQLYLSYNARGDGGELRATHYRFFHDYLTRKNVAGGKTDGYFR
jgi:hypothetical protein